MVAKLSPAVSSLPESSSVLPCVLPSKQVCLALCSPICWLCITDARSSSLRPYSSKLIPSACRTQDLLKTICLSLAHLLPIQAAMAAEEEALILTLRILACLPLPHAHALLQVQWHAMSLHRPCCRGPLPPLSPNCLCPLSSVLSLRPCQGTLQLYLPPLAGKSLAASNKAFSLPLSHLHRTRCVNAQC